MTNMNTVEAIQRDVTVSADPARAFQLFTAGIGSWWPKETHSLAAGEEQAVRSVVFEERTGGRVYEVAADGTEDTWATVLAWEPPTRPGGGWWTSWPPPGR